jgi:multidrug efflux system outer membrane protein
MRKIFVFIFIVTIPFTGCLVGGKYSPQTTYEDSTYVYPHSDSLAQHSDSVNQDSVELVKWTEFYHDEALVKLIQLALDSNRNTMIAVARTEEARERAGIIKANRWPAIGYSAGASTVTAGRNAEAAGVAVDGNSFYASGTLNWELDLFGRIRHLNRAAQAQYLAEEENQYAVKVALVGQTAELYFILRDLDDRLEIARKTLIGRTENTRLITERFNKGYVPELDKLQAEQQEAIVQGSIYDLERQVVEAENALRVLTGQRPGAIVRGLTNDQQVLDAQIPAGIPSQLLLRRPDIRSADREVEVQFNRVGAAKSNMFPSISLTGILGLASPQLTSFVSDESFYAGAAGSLFGPIFEFNKNRHFKKAEEFKLQEVTYQYELIVIQAFSDVDDALYGYHSYTQQLEVLNKQVDAATKALVLTNARYEFGYTSYLEVIIQEDNLFEAELQRSFVLQKKLNSVVNLYRSLGGGW